MKVFPVVMAGGSGTRFWPLSRKARPKQLLPLAGDVPLLRATVDRLPPLAGPAETYVVCGPAHAPAVRALLPELPPANVLVEPCARNTAPCVGLAALHVARRDPAGVLAMLPADHHVARPDALREALAAGARIAEGGALVTLGLRPSRPETGFGYLKLGAPLAGGGPGHRVERFVEKPDAATAARYLADGGYLWNSGIFLFRADVILDEIRRALPALATELDRVGAALGTAHAEEVLAEAFPRCPSISIDYGVMERSARIAVVPTDVGWSDIGSFAALPEVRPQDARGNVIEGAAVVLDGRDNVVLARPDRPVTVIGLDGLVVVDSGDTILVCPKDRAQDVRRAVEAMSALGREDLL